MGSPVSVGVYLFDTMPAGSRRRRLTLAPGGGAPAGSPFDLLRCDDDSAFGDESDADVPFESALLVLDSEPTPESSSVARRGRRSDEELVQDFWTEIGFPTPASRFWEARSASSSSGKSNVDGSVCRVVSPETEPKQGSPSAMASKFAHAAGREEVVAGAGASGTKLMGSPCSAARGRGHGTDRTRQGVVRCCQSWELPASVGLGCGRHGDDGDRAGGGEAVST
jgi:hypothetical protein